MRNEEGSIHDTVRSETIEYKPDALYATYSALIKRFVVP